MTRETIGGNICFTYIPSEKFKTGFFSAQMALPLTAEAAGRNALLVNVLSRGTARCPDIEALGRELDLLYGARLDPTVRKKRTSSSALWPAVWTTASWAGRSAFWSP